MIKDGYGPRPNYWRAPTDNDYGYKMPVLCKTWREASKTSLQARDMNIAQTGDKIEITFNYQLHPSVSTYMTYRIYPSGYIEISMDTRAGEGTPFMPRAGLRMQLPGEYDNVEYFGRGPQENYPDRNTASFVGKYTTKVDSMYVPHVRPQENGYRTDVRYLKLTDNKGRGIMITASRPIGFNTHKNTIEDFDGGYFGEADSSDPAKKEYRAKTYERHYAARHGRVLHRLQDDRNRRERQLGRITRGQIYLPSGRIRRYIYIYNRPDKIKSKNNIYQKQKYG